MTEADTVYPWTFDAVFSTRPDYLIDGAQAGELLSEVATPTTLTLTLRATQTTVTSVLRPLKANEGQVTTLRTDDGGYVAVDRANGANTFEITPPPQRTDLRLKRDMHVRTYEEELVSQTLDEFDVTLELVKTENRTDSNVLDQSVPQAVFDWTFDQTFGVKQGAFGFTTPTSTFHTNRVDAEFIGTGEGGVDRFELTARLTKSEAHTFEADYAAIGAGRIRTIPDEANEAVDDSGGNATLTINSPNRSVIADGEYVVLAWESTRLNDLYQSATMTLAQK